MGSKISAVLYEQVVEQCPELTLLEMMLLCKIVAFDNKKHCYATNSQFAELFHVSEPTISKAVGRLIEKKYVRVEKFDGRRRSLSSSFTQSLRP